MKKRTWVLGMIFMLIVILTATMSWVDRSEIVVRAEAQDGEAVVLAHVHSAEGGACYHQHGDGCYTVPVICNGNITQKRGSVCGTLRKWTGTDDRGITFSYAQCNACGQFWDHVGDDMGDYHYYYDWTCDNCGARYEGGGTCSNVARYDIGCNKDGQIFECENVTCGSYHITCNDTATGLESTTLTANITSQEAGASVTSYQWSTGETSQTITVTQNGTYSCEITYTDLKSGVVSTAGASYEVVNLDNIPPEVALSCVPSSPTNTGTTIHIDATDNVGVTGYSFDGVTFSEEQDYYVTENGDYTAYATDASGNIGSAVITVDNIDHKAPEIVSVTKSTEAAYINGEMRINVTAKDVVSDGYAREVSVKYSADGTNWSDSGEFCLTLDGTREIFVRDAAGNISTVPVTIYQDTTPPRVSGTQNPQGWTKDAVCLTVTASDDQSGIREWAYKWTDGDWNPASLFNVTENGSYEVMVRDGAGNTASYIFRVTQIDRVAPKVEVRLANTDWREGSNTIYVQASDQESGLAKQAYSYDGGVTWTETSEFVISESGDYPVLVRDAVGNITEDWIHAERMAVLPDRGDVAAEPTEDVQKKKVTGELPPMPASDMQVLPSVYPASQPVLEPEQPESEPKIILNISVPRTASPEMEMLEAEMPEVEILETETPEAASPGTVDSWFLRILASVLWGICMGSLFFVLWKTSRKVVLCQKGEDGKYHFVCRMNVKCLGEGKGYSVCINDPHLGEQIAKSLKQDVWQLQFGRHFAQKHLSEKVRIVLSIDNRILTKIERRVHL